MCSGQPFLWIREDVQRVWWGICLPNQFQRMMRLSRRVRRRQSNTARLFVEFMAPSKTGLLQQPIQFLRNGLLPLQVLLGSLNLRKKGIALSQFDWWDKEGEETYRQFENWRNVSARIDGRWSGLRRNWALQHRQDVVLVGTSLDKRQESRRQSKHQDFVSSLILQGFLLARWWSRP